MCLQWGSLPIGTIMNYGNDLKKALKAVQYLVIFALKLVQNLKSLKANRKRTVTQYNFVVGAGKHVMNDK